MRLLCFFLLSLSLLGQDGFYEVKDKPWNGDWLSKRKNTMVGGEEYQGYPGPLPKFFYAMGRDHQHPGTTYELRFNVDRNAPYWFGQCNSWSSAAITYPEPTDVVLHGVKLSSADLKGVLSVFFEHGNPTILAGGPSGLGPEEMERLLFNNIPFNTPLIFDVDLSNETWNFPVAAFAYTSFEDGEWTNVIIDVGYVATQEMHALVEGENNLFYIAYPYRFLTATKTNYQWMGTAVAEHPQRAWVPNGKIDPNAWKIIADRYVDEADYDQFLQLADQNKTDQDVDLFEPNDSTTSAQAIRDNLIMACLPSGDTDYFTLAAQAGQMLEFEFFVYSGPAVTAVLRTPQGVLVEAALNSTGKTFQHQAAFSGDYQIILQKAKSTDASTYYRLVFPEKAGFFQSSAQVDSVRAIQIDTQPSQVYAESVTDLPGNGSMLLNKTGSVVDARTSGETMWASEWEIHGQRHKTYDWKRKSLVTTVLPHVTFRNGWTTSLSLHAYDGSSSVNLRFFKKNGDLLGTQTLALDGSGNYVGSFAQSGVDRDLIAYMEIGEPRQKLDGFACFERVALGDHFCIPIQGHPMNGEMAIFDLKSASKGGTGFVLVNTSGEENLIHYRLMNPSAQIVSTGSFKLLPGEKYINTVNALVPQAGDGYTLMLLSHYNVEGLVVQSAFTPGFSYGHRMLSVHQDSFNETYLSVSGAWDDTQYLVLNPSNKGVHVLFEGYSDDGELQGRFHTILGQVFFPFETRFTPLSQVLQNGVNLGDLERITHFRVTALERVFMLELHGAPSERSRTAVPVVPVYDSP